MAGARAVWVVMAAVIGVVGPPKVAEAPPSRDEVVMFVRAYIDANNGADATAVMDMVSRKPEVSTAEMGVINRGWDAIRAEADKAAGAQGTHTISLGTLDVAFLGPGYVLVVAPVTIDLSVGGNQTQIHAAMTLVLEKSSGKWKMLHEHDSLQFPLGDFPGAAVN